jgi:hypothetical protein
MSSRVISSAYASEKEPAVSSSSTPSKPFLAVYRWSIGEDGGVNGNEAFTKWLGRKIVWAEDFFPSDAWDNIEGGGWQLGPWSDWKKAAYGRRVIFSIPLLPGAWDRSGPKTGEYANQSVSLKMGAKGAYNLFFRKLAQNLVSYGLGNSILRLGWEFNGGWYTWRASDDPADFAEYWRRIVTTMRTVPGAKNLLFDWNPALGWQQFPAEKAWPGDNFVDIVGLDVYDDSWMPDTYPWPADSSPAEIEKRRNVVWDKVLLNGDHGLLFWSKFASAHHKPFSIPEWGVDNRTDHHGGMDDPSFIQRMAEYIIDPTNHVYFHSYFDVQAGDGHHQISPGVKGTEKTEFPLSAALFRKLIGMVNSQ